jgi:hypothetical protein
MSDDRIPLEEHVLRRALRLDADEIPARLDPALVAAAARAVRPARRDVVIVAAVAFLGGWIWSEAVRAAVSGLLGAGAIDPLGAAIQLATGALVAAGPVLDLATHPAIPIAILTAAVLAALSERRRSHVPAS